MNSSKVSRKNLRKFGLFIGFMIVSLFGIISPWFFHKAVPFWPWVVSLILILWSLLIPDTLIVLYKPWMFVGFVLGFINTRILISIIFYFVFTPISIVMKVVRRDPLKRKFDVKASTYRCVSQKLDRRHMERSF